MTDLSADALKLAEENAEKLTFRSRCEFRQGSLLEPCTGITDALFICSNPPYIRKEEAPNLPKEVFDYDPHMALFGMDADALGHHRQILAKAGQHLDKAGFCIFECGFDQVEDLKKLTCENFPSRSGYRDLAGHGRGVIFER